LPKKRCADQVRGLGQINCRGAQVCRNLTSI
jgi:hypothetical protein